MASIMVNEEPASGLLIRSKKLCKPEAMSVRKKIKRKIVVVEMEILIVQIFCFERVIDDMDRVFF